MQDRDFSAYDPRRGLAQEIERRVYSARDGLQEAGRQARNFARGRRLTAGELREIRWMFGPLPGVERTRVFSRNLWWPYPNDRAITPWGNIYFPHDDFYEDFSLPSVPVGKRALFLHEATHLYQWYGLRTWVWITGPFDREYDYVLEKGRPLRGYRLEQMGQIVEEYYLLRHGQKLLNRSYPLSAYADALPVRG